MQFTAVLRPCRAQFRKRSIHRLSRTIARLIIALQSELHKHRDAFVWSLKEVRARGAACLVGPLVSATDGGATVNGKALRDRSAAHGCGR